MSKSEKPRRFQNRKQVRNVSITDEREEELQEAFEQTIPAERVEKRQAATFKVDGDLSDSGVVVSSHLHHERIFDLVGSYAGSSDSDRELMASATVLDVDTEEELSAHVMPDRILISRKTDDMSFESFRDYVLFLESKLHISLEPVLE